MTRLGGSAKVGEVVEKLNATFPLAGYNSKHVSHALNRLRDNYGIVECIGQTWVLSPKARATFNATIKNVRKP
jgi:hypothetical protein